MSEVGAIFITSAVAALLACWGIWSQRALARRQKTLEHFSQMELDKDMIEARRCVIGLIRQNENLASFASTDKADSKETQSIRLILNNFELLAVGIQMNIIDFELYKRFNRDATIQFWKYLAPFITALRARRNVMTLYREFEELADWLEKRPRRNRWYRRLF